MSDRDALVDAAAIMSWMQNSVLPVDTVSEQKPGWWDFPLVRTEVDSLIDGAGWQTLVDVASPEGSYVIVIHEYIVTTLSTLPASGVEFRIMTDDGSMPHVDLFPGIERHRSPAGGPFERQVLFHPVTVNDTMRIEGRNTTGQDVSFVAGLFGWFYYQPTSPGELSSRREGIEDV